jgi:hypothetical protein
MMAQALAPTGALMAFLSLWTGALWGKPMWGTWWVWDARLTSELILLFLYIGFIALQAAIDDPRRADKAGAILALVGVVNIPIIYFSVKWWNTLHQGSVSLTKSPVDGHADALGHAADGPGLLDVQHRRRPDAGAAASCSNANAHRMGARAARRRKAKGLHSLEQFFRVSGHGRLRSTSGARFGDGLTRNRS